MNILSNEEKAMLQKHFESLFNDPRILRIKEIDQHRGSNTYYHVLKVTKLAYKMGKRSGLKVNFKDLITGAMLHDYFLYNWRLDRSKLKGHGRNHPFIALENAKKDFEINEKVENIITSHMWPINFFIFHSCLEAHLVSLADKCVSTKEALTSKKYKEKHRAKELSKIYVLED